VLLARQVGIDGMLGQQHPTPLSLTMALPEPVVDRPVGLAPAPGAM
jgi:hypothetical protein